MAKRAARLHAKGGAHLHGGSNSGHLQGARNSVLRVSLLEMEDMLDGRRRLRFHIRLRGSLILGDGTSDTQNHAIIFVPVEYVQLVDATQDNYLEEALKTTSTDAAELVAIVGAREYMYVQSGNNGILRDVAAREEVFDTLAQRMVAKVGGATKAWYLR
ncbi:MAG: 1,3-beta-glucan synthase component-domain-containing protein [Benniella sp.]|nr:MAG: 1,3-beta-glucan synthase component-domain-containing protein [Benniella sp.]